MKTRAISGGKRKIDSSTPIESCYNFAKKNGYSVFAIQNNKECFTAADANETYTKYKGSNKCNDGKGGSWAQTVYYVACKGKIFQSSVDFLVLR